MKHQKVSAAMLSNLSLSLSGSDQVEPGTGPLNVTARIEVLLRSYSRFIHNINLFFTHKLAYSHYNLPGHFSSTTIVPVVAFWRDRRVVARS
jgi:hypothetical protein